MKRKIKQVTLTLHNPRQFRVIARSLLSYREEIEAEKIELNNLIRDFLKANPENNEWQNK